jgi:hypothetical protein
LEKKIEAEPAAIIAVLKHFGRPFKRIGLEAGPTSSWLYSELRSIGYPAISPAYRAFHLLVPRSARSRALHLTFPVWGSYSITKALCPSLVG